MCFCSDEKRREYDSLFEVNNEYSEEYNPFRKQTIIFKQRANQGFARSYNFYDAYEREYYEDKYTRYYEYKSPEGFYSSHYNTDPFGEEYINWRQEANRHRPFIVRYLTLFGSAVLLYSGAILIYKYFYLNEQKEQGHFQELLNLYHSNGTLSAQQKSFLEDPKIKQLPAWYKTMLLDNEKKEKQTTLQVPGSMTPHGPMKTYGVHVVTDPMEIQKIQQHSEDAKLRRKKELDSISNNEGDNSTAIHSASSNESS